MVAVKQNRIRWVQQSSYYLSANENKHTELVKIIPLLSSNAHLIYLFLLIVHSSRGTMWDGFSGQLFRILIRLIGELIVYPWSGVRRRRMSVRRPQCSNVFFSETAWPIKAKFYVEPPWVGGTKFCSQDLGHMTKMAATPIYGENPSKTFFSRTGGPIFTKLGM